MHFCAVNQKLDFQVTETQLCAESGCNHDPMLAKDGNGSNKETLPCKQLPLVICGDGHILWSDRILVGKDAVNQLLESMQGRF